MMSVLDINWPTIWSHLLLLSIAYVLALPTAWNRERNDRSAGLRTFPLVALSTCGFMLVGIEVLPDPSSQARALQGIITGMGFIGGGAILKSDRTVFRYRDGCEFVEHWSSRHRCCMAAP